jgi:hypothetical protein
MTNAQKYQQNLNPTVGDSDGDGVSDEDDAYPSDPKRSRDVPQVRYAIIKLITDPAEPGPFSAPVIDAAGNIAFLTTPASENGADVKVFTWKNGTLTSKSAGFSLPGNRSVESFHVNGVNANGVITGPLHFTQTLANGYVRTFYAGYVFDPFHQTQAQIIVDAGGNAIEDLSDTYGLNTRISVGWRAPASEGTDKANLVVGPTTASRWIGLTVTDGTGTPNILSSEKIDDYSRVIATSDLGFTVLYSTSWDGSHGFRLWQHGFMPTELNPTIQAVGGVNNLGHIVGEQNLAMGVTRPVLARGQAVEGLDTLLPGVYARQVKFDGYSPYQITNTDAIFTAAQVWEGPAGSAEWKQEWALLETDQSKPPQSRLSQLQISPYVSVAHMNDSGCITGLYNPARLLPDGSEQKDGYGNIVHQYPNPIPVLLLPVEMMVDANRDGEMSFTDAAVHDKDGTTAEKPYRFWVNNDRDAVGTEGVEADVPVANQPDSGLENIACKRDLEDYARLWIDLKGLAAIVKSGNGISVGLQFKPFSGDAWQTEEPKPSIKIFKAVEADGGTLYVTDDNTANQQISGEYDVPVEDIHSASIVGTEPFILPDDFWSDVDETTPKHLIFEGVHAGKGRLVLVIYKNNEKIGEGGALYMDLRDIVNMYECWTVDPPNTTVPANGADPRNVAYISMRRWPVNQYSGFQYSAQDPEDNTYLVFVHGWNEDQPQKEMDADTSYKRLWWQGYKGRFAALQWPTNFGFVGAKEVWDRPQGFDDGEFIAWRSARPLSALLGKFNNSCPGQVYVMAHSHGNVVVGEALRLLGQAGTQINTYVACQAAVNSECYDPTMLFGRFPLPFPLWTGPTTMNVYPNWLTPNAAGVATKVNFFNLNDWALSPLVWEADQELKPDIGWSYSGPVNGTGVFSHNNQSQALGSATAPGPRYPIMSYASESQSRALGRVSGAVFGFTQTVNMSGVVEPPGAAPLIPTFVTGRATAPAMWGSDPLNNHFADRAWHSGQFNFTNMQVHVFWKTFLQQCNLKPLQ